MSTFEVPPETFEKMLDPTPDDAPRLRAMAHPTPNDYDRVEERVFAAFQSMGCDDGPFAPDDITDQAAVAGVVAKWLVDDGVRYPPAADAADVFAAGYRDALWTIKELRDQSLRTNGEFSRASYVIDAASLDAALGDTSER